MEEIKLKAGLVPLSARLRIQELMQYWVEYKLNDLEELYDLFDIYWNENFEKIDRHCGLCVDRLRYIFKAFIEIWTAGQ